jgi:hypothetical protein
VVATVLAVILAMSCAVPIVTLIALSVYVIGVFGIRASAPQLRRV